MTQTQQALVRKIHRYSSTTCSEIESRAEEFQPLWDKYLSSLDDDEQNYTGLGGFQSMLLYADVFVDYESGVIATATTGDVCEIHAAGDYDAEFLEGVTAYMLRAGARKCKMRIRALVHPRQQSAAFAVFRYVGIEIADTLFGGKPENIILLERLSPEQSAPEIPDTVAPEEVNDGLRRDSATGWADVLRQWWSRAYAWLRGL